MDIFFLRIIIKVADSDGQNLESKKKREEVVCICLFVHQLRMKIATDR